MRGLSVVFFLSPCLAFAQQGPQGFIGCYGDAILNVTTFNDRPQVSPGECDVSTGAVLVGAGDYALKNDPECAQDLDALVSQIKPVFDKYASAGLEDWLGPVGSVIYGAIGQNALREIVRLFDRRASCEFLAVKLPDGASFRRARFYIWDQLDGPSHGYRDKPLDDTGDYSKFEGLRSTVTDAGVVVSAVAKNWSNTTPRWVVMHVVYTPESVQRERERSMDSCSPNNQKGTCHR